MPHDKVDDQIDIVPAIIVEPFTDDSYCPLRVKCKNIFLLSLVNTEMRQRRIKNRLVKAFKSLLRLKQVILLVNHPVCSHIILNKAQIRSQILFTREDLFSRILHDNV